MTNETEKRMNPVNFFRQEVDDAVKKVKSGGASEVMISPSAIQGAVEYLKGEAVSDWERAHLLQRAASQYLEQSGVADLRVQVRLQKDLIFVDEQEPVHGPTRFKVDFLRNNGNH